MAWTTSRTFRLFEKQVHQPTPHDQIIRNDGFFIFSVKVEDEVVVIGSVPLEDLEVQERQLERARVKALKGLRRRP